LAWLIISKGSAKQAIEAAPQLERVPTLYLVGTMDHAVHMGKIPNIFLGNYWSIQSSKGRDPILPFISVHGKDRIKIEGLAVFKGNRMVSHLDQLGVAAYMELTNEHHAGYGVAVPMPGDPVHSVIIKGTSRKTRVKMSKENNKPVFDVYERIEANIEEITGNVRNSSERMNQIGNETTRLLIKNQEATLKKLQEMHTDIIGFGEYVRGQYPEYWFRLRQQKDWGDEFEHLNIRLHLKVYMRRIGMSTR
jgi:spore germination protein KC